MMYGAGSVGKVVKMWVLGLELWHRINSAPWHGGAELQWSIEGSTKLAPKSSCLAQHDPVTIEYIHALHCCLDLTNSFDIAIFAIACIPFWCCFRLCKLIIDMNFDPFSHVACLAAFKCGMASN